MDVLFSVPPADELRRLVYLYGGRYQQYYSKRSVTHIIATNLPDSKIKELRYILFCLLEGLNLVSNVIMFKIPFTWLKS